MQHLVYLRDQLGRKEWFLDSMPGTVQKLRALIGGKHAKAGAFQNLAHGFAHNGVIFHNEDRLECIVFRLIHRLHLRE